MKKESTISKRLVELRKENGLKQFQVAEIAGVSIQTMSKYESADISVSVEKIRLLADYYNVDPAYLAGWTNDKHPKEYNGIIEYAFMPKEETQTVESIKNHNKTKWATLPETFLSKSKDYFAAVLTEPDIQTEQFEIGDMIIFEKTDAIENHEVGCFSIDGENVFIAELLEIDNQVVLNKKYPVIVNHWAYQCLGKAVAVIKSFQ